MRKVDYQISENIDMPHGTRRPGSPGIPTEEQTKALRDSIRLTEKIIGRAPESTQTEEDMAPVLAKCVLVDSPDHPSLCEIGKMLSDTDAVLAVDTEFVRTNTFYPVAALIQVSDGETAYLIDPIGLGEKAFSDVARQFSDAEATLLMFSMHEDLEVFLRYGGSIPKRVEDLQIMAGFAGLEPNVGLAATLASAISLELKKEQTTSLWLQRPLDNAQLCYAAQDVLYLHKTRDKFMEEMRKRGNEFIFQEEMSICLSDANQTTDDTDYVSMVDAMRQRATKQDVDALRRLMIWRIQTARKLNRAPGQIIPNKALWNIARERPETVQELVGCGVHGNSARLNVSEISNELRKASGDSDVYFPDPEKFPLIQSLSTCIATELKDAAIEAGMSPALGCSKKKAYEFARWHLETAKNQGRLPTPYVMKGQWRSKIALAVAASFLEKLRQS